MTRLIRYDPFRDMQRMVDNMNSVLERSRLWDEDWTQTNGTTPLAIDMRSTDSEMIVRTAIPGVSQEDIDISINNKVLTISAETRSESTQEGDRDSWHFREMRYGKFSRAIRLPEDVNADKAEAALENGVLTITLPKQQSNPAKRIAVKAKQIISGDQNGSKAVKAAN